MRCPICGKATKTLPAHFKASKACRDRFLRKLKKLAEMTVKEHERDYSPGGEPL